MASGLYWYSTERQDKAKELIHKNMTLHPDNLGTTAAYVQILGYMKDWDTMEKGSLSTVFLLIAQAFLSLLPLRAR